MTTDAAGAEIARRRTKSRLGRLALEALAYLRGEIRASEVWLVVIAAAVGAAAGLATIGVGLAAHTLQQTFYGINFDERLSALVKIPHERLIALPIGGALLAGATWLWLKRRPSAPVDPVPTELRVRMGPRGRTVHRVRPQ